MPYQTLTVYLGSSGHARDIFKNEAAKLGRLMAASDKTLVYGGMDAGLMGIIARTVLENGAAVIGIIPQKLKDSERILKNLSETVLVQDLWERKRLMFQRADAIIALPGGFGTLDEALEVLYWAALGLHNKPLVLVNTDGYWDLIIEFLHTLPDFKPEFLIVASDAETALQKLDSWPKPADVPDPDDLPHFESEISRETLEPIIVEEASVKNSYYLACALGLKQLAKHQRPIGIMNGQGQFTPLLQWFERAAVETFITQKCLTLYSTGNSLETLKAALHWQKAVEIDLHKDKWGD